MLRVYCNNEDNKEEVNQKLIAAIRDAVNKRLVAFTHEVDVEREKSNITVVATIKLLRNGKTYSPVLKVTSTTDEKEGENFGNSYVAFTQDEILVTLTICFRLSRFLNCCNYARILTNIPCNPLPQVTK